MDAQARINQLEAEVSQLLNSVNAYRMQAMNIEPSIGNTPQAKMLKERVKKARVLLEQKPSR